MSKLSEVFETIISQMHWGPSHRPFLEAVIAEHDALEARVEDMEKAFMAAITTGEAFILNGKLVEARKIPPAPQEQVSHPAITYIDPIEVAPNPAGQMQTPTADLPAQPESDHAGPDSAL